MFSNKFGLAALLKEGGKLFSGVDDVTLKNIEACRTLSTITQTSLGPNSMNKLVLNHIEKRFVTSDAATIVNELEVQHPAAKLIVQAAKMQEAEFGDATNLVIVFAGELLSQAETLLTMGIHTSDIAKGYQLALEKCLEYLEDCVCWKVNNILSVNELYTAIKPVLASKQSSGDADIAELVARAALIAMPPNPLNFNVDYIRVTQVVGGSTASSFVVNGMVLPRSAEGLQTKKKNAKVIVLSCGLEMTGTESTGTVLLRNAEDLLNFTKSEEDAMEKLIKGISDTGVEMIISNGNISDTAQHYCNKYNLITLRVPSKHDIRRICKSFNIPSMIRLGVPLAEEIGIAEEIEVQEISSKKFTIIRAKDSRVGTIVLRGATRNMLDELERGIDDAISCVKSVTFGPSFVAGAGATEIELASKLQDYGATVPGLDQYAVLRFATALESIPKIIAENSGYKPTEAVTKLYAAHQQGQTTAGVNIVGPGVLVDAKAENIFDHKETKAWALKFAVEAALTVLRVDQIVMAKPAGGPAMRPPGPPDLD